MMAKPIRALECERQAKKKAPAFLSTLRFPGACTEIVVEGRGGEWESF